MQPEIETLLLVMLLTDAVGLGAVAVLRRNAALRIAIVLLVPVLGTATQLIALQLRDADRSDQHHCGNCDLTPVTTGAVIPRSR